MKILFKEKKEEKKKKKEKKKKMKMSLVIDEGLKNTDIIII